MEDKRKTEYISKMLNKRTKGKGYENFVINQIYARIDNPELEIVTQKCIRINNSSFIGNESPNKNFILGKSHYLVDLYFPQINFAIEVDEGYHEDRKKQFNDQERQNYIKNAVSCKIERIKICEKDSTTNLKKYEDILTQIKKIVDKIKNKISQLEQKKGALKWITNEEKMEQVKEDKFFDIKQDVHFGGITNVLNLLPGRQYTLYQRCVKGYDDYIIWIPVLSIKTTEGNVKTANGWINFINEDGTEISEYPSSKDYPKTETFNAKAGSCPQKWCEKKRVIFMKMKDEFGNNCCRFLGVFKADHIEYEEKKQKRIYKRISTKVKFDDIVRKKI